MPIIVHRTEGNRYTFDHLEIRMMIEDYLREKHGLVDNLIFHGLYDESYSFRGYEVLDQEKCPYCGK